MKITELKILVASALLFMPASSQALQPEVLYAFQAASPEPANANGANPLAGLVLGSDGHFYGTTEAGGSSGDGTIFRMTHDGVLTTLASFDGVNGALPEAKLASGSDGNFYGTTSRGGGSDDGTVFRVTTNGVLTSLVSFNGTNGAYPTAELLLGTDGNFYGTTAYGGSGATDYPWTGSGTVFKVTTNGVLTSLVSFNDTNGANPLAGLVLGGDGDFYGTTERGGTNGVGSVFKVTANGVLTTLVSFAHADGLFPSAGLALGSDGNFYGTTRGSLRHMDFGTVFRMTANGVLTTLVSFSYTNGFYPQAGLIEGNDGNLYGTTAGGGSSDVNGNGSGSGTVFQMTTNGVLTTLAWFNGANGAAPNELVLGSDGNLYGTTANGGPGGGGTIYRLVISPKFTNLAKQPGGSMLLTGTGPANGSYRLWTSADLSLPASSWTLLMSASFDSNGNFSHPDAGAATNPSRFYKLSVP